MKEITILLVSYYGILTIAMILSTDDVSCICVERYRSHIKGSKQRAMMPWTRFKDGQGCVLDTRKVRIKHISIKKYR